jgi:hypothetical protein
VARKSRKLLKLLELESFSDKMKSRIELLRQWAEENRFMESKERD